MKAKPDASSVPSIAERAARVIPGGVNSAQRSVPGLEDLVIVATRGATFSDDRGRTFTDYHSAFGPPILGHNDQDVDRAAARAASGLDVMGIGVTEIEVELAEALVAAVPSVEKVLLTVTGSEATFHAIRVARAATSRRLLVKFQGCYHGWHDSVAMNVISQPEMVGRKDPLSAEILPEVLEATIVLPFNDLRRWSDFSPSGGQRSRLSSSNLFHTISERSFPSQVSSRGSGMSVPETGRC